MRVSLPSRIAPFLFVCVAFLGGAARGEILYDNLAVARDSRDSVYNEGWLGQKFSTKNFSGKSFVLNDATLFLGQRASRLPTLQLFSDDGTTPQSRPGSLLSTLTLAGTLSSSDYAPTPFTSTGYSLAANTDYWLVLSFLGQGSGDGNVKWGYVSQANMNVGTNGNTYHAYNYNSYGNPNAWAVALNSPLMMQVNASVQSAVPEIDPAGIGSVGAVVAGAIGLLERRRKKSA